MLSITAALVAALIIYCVVGAIHRLYLSPLARFPGPKLAALTHWYEAYYDLISKNGGGQFAFQIKRMHERYGPIVRINPAELHIDDPDFYNQIYCNSSASRPIDKSSRFKHRFGMPQASFSTTLGEHHRLRRSAIAPFFSKARIQSLGGKLETIIERVSYRLSTEYAGSGRVINLVDMWGGLAADVITELAFGRSPNFTSAPDFKSGFAVAVSNLQWYSHWTQHIWFLVPLMNSVPDNVLSVLMPMFKPIVDFRKDTIRQIKENLAGEVTEAEEKSSPTLFHDMLSSGLPEQELTLQRLTDECMHVTGAGQETITWTLSLICFHALDNPDIHARLKAELIVAMPDPRHILPWEDLEKLPYLMAVINEGLRLSYGQVSRLPRIHRLAALNYNGIEIPAGVTVGMDNYHMHTNETIFPDALEFKPERWLGDPTPPGRAHPLSHYLVPFGKGSRACIVIYLAQMELVTVLATIWRRHEFELFDTDRTDVEFVLDMLRPMPKRGSKGVRVIVKS
ncbi:cytochrome P450 [Nemania sp. FL0916]|nr:cytochrome P450 [Nemania sp. FL0916]